MPKEHNKNLTSCSNQVRLLRTLCARKTWCATKEHLPQPLAKKQKQKPTITTTTTTVRPYGGARIPLETETGSVTKKMNSN